MKKLIHTVICDDIRVEVANKFSYMGIYEKDIVVPTLPLKVPKICFIQFLLLEKGKYRVRQILMSPTKEIGRVDFNEQANVISDTENFVFRSAFENITIDELGEYQLQLYFDDQLAPDLTHKFKIIPLK